MSTAGAQQSQVDNLGNLQECVAEFFGASGDPYYLKLALNGIQRAVRRLNMWNIHQFGRRSAADITIVDGTDDYSLPDSTFIIETVQLVETSGDVQPKHRLDYAEWAALQRRAPDQSEKGQPTVWTAKNEFDDETIQILPIPDANTASTYKLRITYYDRIAVPTSANDVIDAPEEMSNVLCMYGEYYVASALGHPQSRVQQLLANAEDARASFTAMMDRKPGGHDLGMQVAWTARTNPGSDPLNQR